MNRQPKRHLTLRLPAPLREWIARQAEQNDRSMNSEITFRLEMARMGLQPPRPTSGGQPAVGEAS